MFRQENNRMYKERFIVEISLTKKQYAIAKKLNVPIKTFLGELSPFAKLKRKIRNEE
jgi:hypothetical protein